MANTRAHRPSRPALATAAILSAACLGSPWPHASNAQPAPAARAAGGWFAFNPGHDPATTAGPIDLRSLNEKQAGASGFIGVKDGRFVQERTGRSVRFWGVNGPSGQGPAALRREARLLARRGVNLVRLQQPYHDKAGEVDLKKVAHALDVVEAMKAEGIYTHFSIYFPLGLRPTAETPWLRGYDGKTVPFAALFFNDDFQRQYRTWCKALLLTPSPTTGKRLVDDPAVAGLEVLNEDSYFFWTFNPKAIPDPQLRILETRFGDWLAARHGSVDAALKRWRDIGAVADRDRPAEGRVGFRPLWNLFNQKTGRDQETARFLAESQRGFYESTYKFLREIGFRGAITPSNWTTASPEVLGPIEKYSYTAGDFLDRHGYFAGRAEGPDASWAIKPGLTYSDRSALRFDPETPGKPRLFVNPVMEVKYAGKPSMLSEVAWNRPNRFRSEAPLYLAAFAALQGTDAVVHFTLDGSTWSVKPQYFMQPWTLMSPAMMGQFPAAALIYRKGLIAEGDVLAALTLGLDDLYDLKGTPLPQGAAFDELRAKDVPRGQSLRPGNVIDPLIHYAGRTAVTFSDRGAPPVLKDLRPYVDRARQTVVSTNGHLRLDYGKGVLFLNAPAAQGISGALSAAGVADLADLSVASAMPIGHIVAVSLDDRPLATSRRILLQVMSEEKATGFRTVPAAGGRLKVADIGRDPWLVRSFEGTVRLKRSDAQSLAVSALDPHGRVVKPVGTAAEIRLAPTTLYYLIEAGAGR